MNIEKVYIVTASDMESSSNLRAFRSRAGAEPFLNMLLEYEKTKPQENDHTDDETYEDFKKSMDDYWEKIEEWSKNHPLAENGYWYNSYENFSIMEMDVFQ